MSRIFKPTYKDKKGKKKEYRKWWIELRDHNEIIRRFAGLTDRKQTKLLGQQIQRLINCKVAGEQPDVSLTKWLEAIPGKMQEHFTRIGLLSTQRAAAGKPLSEHLDDFRRSIGDDTKHARCTYSALVRVFEACKFTYWSEIQASSLDNCLKDLDVSQRTYNFYLKAAKQFCRWMVKDRRASESPVAYLDTVEITERRIQRRAIEVDELRRLLQVTEAAPERFGMTGHERALLYRLACETGLRANELRSLKVSSFDLTNRTVTVQAVYSKNKKQSILHFNQDIDTACHNLGWRHRMPETKAFNVPDKTAKMLRADLADAGIAYKDEAGRVFDFHALRHQTGTMLAASGVLPKDAQEIMRHSNINLTMQIYTHTLKGSQAAAVAKLPDLSTPSKKEKKAGA